MKYEYNSIIFLYQYFKIFEHQILRIVLQIAFSLSK